MSAREQGQVKWFNNAKGFGFIQRATGEDVFVHFRSIVGDGYRSLREGEMVEFVVTEGDKGLQAEEVTRLMWYLSHAKPALEVGFFVGVLKLGFNISL